MIDVYVVAGTFASEHDVAQQMAEEVKRWARAPISHRPLRERGD
jgi:hypothetical protein